MGLGRAGLCLGVPVRVVPGAALPQAQPRLMRCATCGCPGSGGASQTVTTNSAGYYSALVPVNKTYTVAVGEQGACVKVQACRGYRLALLPCCPLWAVGAAFPHPQLQLPVELLRHMPRHVAAPHAHAGCVPLQAFHHQICDR